MSNSYLYVNYLHTYVLYCFGSYPVLVIGVVPTLMGNVCVCMYVCSGQSEEAGEGHEHRETMPSSFRQVSWFILRADRDTGPTA